MLLDHTLSSKNLLNLGKVATLVLVENKVLEMKEKALPLPLLLCLSLFFLFFLYLSLALCFSG